MTTHDVGDERLRYRKSFAAEPSPHFFKIIISDSLQSGKLGIPEGFSRRYASSLLVSKSVLLQVPGGTTWPVELEKRDGRVWFRNGWQEFVDHHSLGHGHLLVFRYEGDSTFHVIIFDKSACEIDYPLQEGGFLSPKREEEEEADDDDVELQILSGFQPNSRKLSDRSRTVSCSKWPPDVMQRSYSAHKVKNAHSPPLPPAESKSLKSETGGDGFHWWKRDESPRSPSTKELKGRVKQSQCRASTPVHVRGDHTLLVPPLPIEAISQFKSKYPFFKLVIWPSYLKGSASIPCGFIRKHVRKSPQIVMLRHAERSWPVTLKSYRGSSRGIFLVGWAAFASETNLMKGDVCLFELIDPKDYVLRVSIFRKHVVNLD